MADETPKPSLFARAWASVKELPGDVAGVAKSAPLAVVAIGGVAVGAVAGVRAAWRAIKGRKGGKK